MVYVAKISEAEMKGDVENSMGNHFKQIGEEQITGLKVILGSWTIHLVEGSANHVKNLIKRVNA